MDGNCDSVGRRAILHYYFRLILINSFVTCRGIPTLEIVSDFPGSQAGWKVDCSAVFPTKFNYQENFIQDYTILLYQSKLCETGVAMVGNIKVWQKSNMSWQAIRWECESYEWWGRRGRIRHKFILFFSRDKYSAQLWQKILEPQILFVCKLESDQLRTGRVWPDLGRRTNTRVARQPGGLAEDEWEFCVLMNFWEPVTVAANWAGWAWPLWPQLPHNSAAMSTSHQSYSRLTVLPAGRVCWPGKTSSGGDTEQQAVAGLRPRLLSAWLPSTPLLTGNSPTPSIRILQQRLLVKYTHCRTTLSTTLQTKERNSRNSRYRGRRRWKENVPIAPQLSPAPRRYLTGFNNNPPHVAEINIHW